MRTDEEGEVPPELTSLTCADDCARVCGGSKRAPRAKSIKTGEGRLRNTIFEAATTESLLSKQVQFRGYRYEKGARDYPPFGWEGRTEILLRCQHSLAGRKQLIEELGAQGKIPPEALRIERIIEH